MTSDYREALELANVVPIIIPRHRRITDSESRIILSVIPYDSFVNMSTILEATSHLDININQVKRRVRKYVAHGIVIQKDNFYISENGRVSYRRKGVMG